ncbi:MAG: hypothetical protein ACR2IL_02195 [Chitinophagaceae bacterium]
MSNRWGIPKDVEEYVIIRDTNCVYCRIPFNNDNPTRKTKPTWEHIINDIKINGIDNIARCCGSCNASKGNKHLKDWLNSKYCAQKNISLKSLASVVKAHL